MGKTFCVTIDTEPDCDIHWRRSLPLSFESVTYGIPQLLRPIWDTYSIKPVYFISPEVAGSGECCGVLKKEIQLGAEIGTHLHSEYIEPQKKFDNSAGTASDEFPCFAYSKEVELEKIKNLTELIEKNLGVRPVSYRAARYGADMDTIKILSELNYKVDSSVTPNIDWSRQGGPDHKRAPWQPYFISKEDYCAAGDSTILEAPITIGGKRLPLTPDKWLFYRWLRPSHMTGFEMKRLIDDFLAKDQSPVLNMMFHSMEVIPKKSPFVRTRIGQKMYLHRLERIIRYLLKTGFECKTLKMIYDEKLRTV